MTSSTDERAQALDGLGELIVDLQADVPVLRDEYVAAARARFEGGFYPSCFDLADSIVVCIVADRLR